MSENLAVIEADPTVALLNIKTIIDNYAERCANFIVTRETLDEGEEMAKEARHIGQKIEEVHKKIKAPYLKITREIDGAKNTVLKALDEATASLRGQILGVKRAIEAERQAEARRLAEEIRLREEALRNSENEAKATAAEFDRLEASRQQAAVVNSAKTTGIRKVWKHRLINLDEVPRAYLMLNDAAVKAAIAGGARLIPGIEIFQEEQLNLR